MNLFRWIDGLFRLDRPPAWCPDVKWYAYSQTGPRYAHIAFYRYAGKDVRSDGLTTCGVQIFVEGKAPPVLPVCPRCVTKREQFLYDEHLKKPSITQEDFYALGGEKRP